jgi:hypothetical protein
MMAISPPAFRIHRRPSGFDILYSPLIGPCRVGRVQAVVNRYLALRGKQNQNLVEAGVAEEIDHDVPEMI